MPRILLILIVVGGFSARFIGLSDHCFWLDEFTSVEIASKPIISILKGEGFDSHTPPFYYILISLWSSLFALDEFGLRFFSVVVDSINILLIFFVFSKSFGEKVGLGAALLFSASPYSYYYAQEGRMYSLLMLLSLCSIDLCGRVVLQGWTRLRFIAAVTLFVFGAYTHYYYPLFVIGLTIGMFLHFLSRASKGISIRPRWENFGLWIFAGILAAVCFLPWFSTVWHLFGKGGQVFRSSDPLRLLIYFPYTLFRFLAGYGSLPLTLNSKQEVVHTVIGNLPLISIYLLSSIIFFALGWSCLKKTDFGKILSWGILLPPVLAYLVSLRAPMLSDRYLSVIYPVFIVFVSAGICSLRGLAKNLSIGIVGLLSLLGLVSYHSNPGFGNIDWRLLSKQIERANPKPEKIFVNPEYFKKLVASYLPSDIEVLPVSTSPSSESAEMLEELELVISSGVSFGLIEVGSAESVIPLIKERKKVYLQQSQEFENGVDFYRVEN